MNAAARLRATEIVLNRQLAEHESAHCASALLLGLDVHEVRAPFHKFADLEDRDPADAAGHVLIEHSNDPDDLRKVAITTLAGGLEEGDPYWPPTWPLTLVPATGDEADLVGVVKQLGLDQASYSELVSEARELAASRPYERLRMAIEHLLEQHGHLDQRALRRIKAITEGAAMEHLTLKAVTTVSTDQGVFEAVISTESVDREKDIVSAAGMVNALRKWNRPIPLAWRHSTDAADIFGHIDPATVSEAAGEVVAGGQVHLDSDVGREAWRSFKSRAIGFSFGYLILDATKRSGGGRHITSLDVFEVTATPTPMNNDTRVLSTKALDPDREPPSLEELRARERELGLDEDHEARQQIADEFRTLLTDAMGHTNGNGTDNSKSLAALREKAAKIEREFGEVQIASFEC